MLKSNITEFYQALTPGKAIISIDYGTRKLGIAISSSNLSLALPITIIDARISNPIIEIEKLIKQYNICGIVVGLPVNMNGILGERAELVQQFAKTLAAKFDNQPIYLRDERLTSKAADNLLKSAGFNRQQRNQVDDSIAASLILDTVLNIINNIKVAK